MDNVIFLMICGTVSPHQSPSVCTSLACRGDGSTVNCHLAVVRHHTNAAVFSIDGSFAAKFTVTGRDPKMISGSVEVVRCVLSVSVLVHSVNVGVPSFL